MVVQGSITSSLFHLIFSLQDFMNVKLGHLFLEASNMLLVFEQYCVQQAAATTLLEQLEREKELLRIFLQVGTTRKFALSNLKISTKFIIIISLL